MIGPNWRLTLYSLQNVATLELLIYGEKNLNLELVNFKIMSPWSAICKSHMHSESFENLVHNLPNYVCAKTFEIIYALFEKHFYWSILEYGCEITFKVWPNLYEMPNLRTIMKQNSTNVILTKLYSISYEGNCFTRSLHFLLRLSVIITKPSSSNRRRMRVRELNFPALKTKCVNYNYCEQTL